MTTEEQRDRVRELYVHLQVHEPALHTIEPESCAIPLGEEGNLDPGEDYFFRIVYRSDEGPGHVTLTLPSTDMPDLQVEVDGEEVGEIPLDFAAGFRVGDEEYENGDEVAAEIRRRLDGILPNFQERKS